MHHRFMAGNAAGILAVAGSSLARAQASTAGEITRYRQMLADDNPAELWEARGAELWKTKAGPKNVSLEQCDLGKGPGVVKGAYAEMPRYFSDTGRVMDLEHRLVTTASCAGKVRRWFATHGARSTTLGPTVRAPTCHASATTSS